MLAPAMRREKSPKLAAASPKSGQERLNGRNHEDAWPIVSRDHEAYRQTDVLLAIVDKVNDELGQCRFPIGRIKCECDAKSLYLTGVTSAYYYLQVALEAAQRHAGDTPVQLKVVVAQAG